MTQENKQEQQQQPAPQQPSDPTRISPADYIANRVQGQIDYFNRKSGFSQQKYKKYKRWEFILAASIPVTVTFSSMEVAKKGVFLVWNGAEVNLDLLFQITAAVAGIIMAILSKVIDLEDYLKNWKEYRVNAEALEHEKHLYMTRTGEYEVEKEAFGKFVDKVESILNNDVQRWKQKNKEQEEPKQKVDKPEESTDESGDDTPTAPPASGKVSK